MGRSVRNVPGDYGEIGVYRGAAFKKLAFLAHEQQRIAHAFDSFHGMGDPGPEDGEQYPRGKFDIGGPESFVRLMDEAGVPRGHYRLWPGFIPSCFKSSPAQARFSPVMIDVDHYQPTAESLVWAAPRVSRGGVLALDDYLSASVRLRGNGGGIPACGGQGVGNEIMFASNAEDLVASLTRLARAAH